MRVDLVHLSNWCKWGKFLLVVHFFKLLFSIRLLKNKTKTAAKIGSSTVNSYVVTIVIWDKYELVVPGVNFYL